MKSIYLLKKTDRIASNSGVQEVSVLVGYCATPHRAEKKKKFILDNSYKYNYNGKTYPIIDILTISSLE
jgi:hypothetical protein